MTPNRELDARYAAASAAYTAAYRAYTDASGPAERDRLEAARAVLVAVTAELVAEEDARYPHGVPGGTFGT